MVTYVRRFILNCGKLMAPLSTIARDKSTFLWAPKRDLFFQETKNLPCAAPILLLFPRLKLTLQAIDQLFWLCYWWCSLSSHWHCQIPIGSLWGGVLQRNKQQTPYTKEIGRNYTLRQMAVLTERSQKDQSIDIPQISHILQKPGTSFPHPS